MQVVCLAALLAGHVAILHGKILIITVSVKPATNLKLGFELTEAFSLAGTWTAALKHLANLIPTSTVLLPI